MIMIGLQEHLSGQNCNDEFKLGGGEALKWLVKKCINVELSN